MITENLSTLKIHKLTQAQYERERDANRLDETAVYLTPDESLVIDDALSRTSTNPVQNKVINDALSNKANHDHSHGVATTSVAGFISAEDKVKIDNMIMTVDDELSSTSTNPVQNKVVEAALNNKANTDHDHAKYALSSDVSDLQLKVGNTSVSEQIATALDGFSSGKTLSEHLTEEDMVLVSNKHYGGTLPSPGTPGRIFFLKVSE